jgi:hypothetical protein
MSGTPGVPTILGLDNTNLFNFGNELDQINANIASIINDRIKSDALMGNIATQQTQAFADINRQLAALNTTMVQVVQLLQAALLGLTEGANLINIVIQRLGGLPGAAQSVGLDNATTATQPQTPPTKQGP